jgi:hypothetical protein
LENEEQVGFRLSEEIELRDGVCCAHCHNGTTTNFSDAVFCKKLGKDVLKTKMCMTPTGSKFIRKEDKE